MADDFKYDVFLSHSSKDKATVRAVAERLRTDGLRVWFDEWEIRAGDDTPAKIEEGLEHSRVLVLCMSARAFSSDWAQLESYTFRFRNPLNKERRFIPLRLDEAEIKGSLAQYSYINWLLNDREQVYAKLLEACRPPVALAKLPVEQKNKLQSSKVLKGHTAGVRGVAISGNAKRAVSCSHDQTVRVWDLDTGQCIATLEGHTSIVNGVAVSWDAKRVVSCSFDYTVRVWDAESGQCTATLEGHTDSVWGVAMSGDAKRAVSCSNDRTVRVWDLDTGQCLATLEGHTNIVRGVALSEDGMRAISCSDDGTVRVWELETGKCIATLEGHTAGVSGVAVSGNAKRAVSCSNDRTVRMWDLDTGQCLAMLEGHTASVWRVVMSWNAERAISCSNDRTVRVWDLNTGQCLAMLEGHTSNVTGLAMSGDAKRAVSCSSDRTVRVWELPPKEEQVPQKSAATRYTNAKVLLVGESGAGKTGLFKVLAGEKWQLSDSTVGAWATQLKLPVPSDDGIEREIWLWDFGGQADQRLIHQLYMDETALAMLVFDGQKEDLFKTLGQWDCDLTRASRNPFTKLLVAGRVDAGSLGVSRVGIEAFAKEHGYVRFLETSAKHDLGCEELKKAILDSIRWKDIPWRSSPLLFKRLKEEILHLKDEGRVLMRFNELRETLQLRLSGEVARFNDEELRTVISLLTGPGVVCELSFGNLVLLQPERINAYAQAVIQTMNNDEHVPGCLPEERVLNGDLTYHSSIERLEANEEKFILLAMHETLLKRGLCLRQDTFKGALLIFPSYFRRERPELIGHPAVLVSYRFSGFLDDIYATLVVRMHHTGAFEQDRLWYRAADFKTLTGKQLGVKIIHREEGAGELEVYFDPTIELGEKIIFSKYVHEHLLQNARDVARLRYYVCPYCGTPVGNCEVAMRKLEEGKKDIPCINCENRIPLWDQLEEMFASPEMKKRVSKLQKKSDNVLDNESKDRALVGDVICTVALAGQLSREFNVSDHGIDMEIEFKSDKGEATGQKLYLQLKSGDSYLKKRKRDGVEIFTIKNERHIRYWMAQKFPVMLVIRNSEGEVRWMEVRDYLKRASSEGKKPAKQIIFDGECFNETSVLGWRDRVLQQNLPQ